ncbi:DMT family transporter [uncultured Piscinibacter sp.]|uniref:DMT family transporter n=1 Tax=uncultured Piscinibacter sp. TaxID=1131835 RepID=UPI00262C32D4|nr:DMT family transporter [uncultured Piscinibacter sp.]
MDGEVRSWRTWSERTAKPGARLRHSDLQRLLAMAGFGAVIGPVALAWGLQHTGGTSAAPMLTLAALFTAAWAWRPCHEALDGRIPTAMALPLAGGVVLHLAKSHGHDHGHEALERGHAHRHDDSHHHHVHDPMPEGNPSHPHRRETMRHGHAHVPDAHHAHRHRRSGPWSTPSAAGSAPADGLPEADAN